MLTCFFPFAFDKHWLWPVCFVFARVYKAQDAALFVLVLSCLITLDAAFFEFGSIVSAEHWML